MTDNELLLSISNMMDYKLEPVNRNIQGLKEEITGVKGEIAGIKKDITGIKGEIAGIKEDITDIKTRVKKIELTQETQILPRLNTIEACYISTFERYKDSVETYDSMKQDISVMKKVLAEHSEKLQKLA